MILRILFFFIYLALNVGSFARDSISVQMKVSDHPRLFLLKGEEKLLLQNIKKDTVWNGIHKAIIRQCDLMLTQPVNERVMVGRRLLHTSRDVLHKVFSLSYAFRLTGDKKYSHRAIREMLKAASFNDWNPSHFLDVAEMTLAFAIGYDWNFDQLSKNDRKTVKTAIFEKGLNPSLLPQNNAWLTVDNNWNQVCNAGISLGALAVYEDDPDFAVGLLNRAIRSLPAAMKVYVPDGAYPEGAAYWAYGTTFNCVFLDAIEKIYKSNFGLADIPGFIQTGRFHQVMIAPSLHYFAHSDGNPEAHFEPAVFWFYGKTKDPVLMHFQERLIPGIHSNSFQKKGLFPLALLWGVHGGVSISSSSKPKDLMWFTKSNPAVAVMRSSWSDSNALFLAFKGGSPSLSHAHMDGGSFYIEANGVKWGLDPGGHDYYTLEKNGVTLWDMTQESQRWDIFRISNHAHNTLTINNEKQLVMGNAPIEKVSTDTNLMFVQGDLSSLYNNTIKTAKRAVGMIDKSYVLVEDIITSNEKPATIKWNMTTMALNVTKLSPNTFLLTLNEKKFYVKIEGPNTIRSYFKPATPTLPFELPNPGVSLFGFEFDLAPNDTQHIKVYLMPEKEFADLKPSLFTN